MNRLKQNRQKAVLDLVEYLYHYSRQEALHNLCRMAGIPFDEKESDSQPRSRFG